LNAAHWARMLFSSVLTLKNLFNVLSGGGSQGPKSVCKVDFATAQRELLLGPNPTYTTTWNGSIEAANTWLFKRTPKLDARQRLIFVKTHPTEFCCESSPWATRIIELDAPRDRSLPIQRHLEKSCAVPAVMCKCANERHLVYT